MCFDYRFEKKHLIPLGVSKTTDYDFDLDLLLLSDDKMHHYVLITDLKGLLCSTRGILRRFASHVCRRCFHLTSSKAQFLTHNEFCQNQKLAVTNMPLPENASKSFRGKQARWFAPVIGFFDLESLIVPVEGCQQDPKHSSTRSIEKHLPCSSVYRKR